MQPKHLVSDDIIFYAFRYCLGRQTYAVSDFVHEVIYLAEKLHIRTKTIMIKEINEALETDRAGADIDKAQWIRLKAILEKSEE